MVDYYITVFFQNIRLSKFPPLREITPKTPGEDVWRQGRGRHGQPEDDHVAPGEHHEVGQEGRRRGNKVKRKSGKRRRAPN